MIGPKTAVDTLYATKFPTCDELENFVLYGLPPRIQATNSHMEWYAELGPNNHANLQRIFESRLDPEVAREVGENINEQGGKQAMVANFYVYCHFVGERLKYMDVTHDQFAEIHYVHAKMLEKHWNGIGDWVW